MKIKRLEICGFKSFVDRTTVSFPEPITAIVGPNGCGKSNIVDAIRWCMGEQSAKHLRGRSMDDVIFAGSESRGPAGMAEVSLTFDTTGLPVASAPGGVPWGEAAPEEIVISRRLFRDGTSEYLLGGVPCRLRDIVSFFLGTGVGTKAYSIIEQGRVGFIVSSKPEDRRILIDEAAGITKYKAKKKQAERRMDSTRQHLLRVSDVIAEIESRLRSLRLQAQKAERYKRYKEELRELELWEASHRYLGHLAEEKSGRAALAELAAEHDEKSIALVTQETQVDTERLSLAQEQAELEAIKDEIHGLSNQANLDAQLARHQEEDAARLFGQADDADRECNDLHERVARNIERIAELDSRLQVLEGEAERAEAAHRDQETIYDGLRDELADARRQSDVAARAAADGRARIARDESDLAGTQARRIDLAQRIEAASTDGARAAERLAGLHGETNEFTVGLATVREREGHLAGQRNETLRVVETLKEQVARGGMEIETLREEAHRRRSRLQSLREIQTRYESFERGVRAIMQKCQSGAVGSENTDTAGVDGDAWLRGSSVRGLVADIMQPPPELEPAVEAVLGSRLGNIIVESHEIGIEAVQFLKERSEGRSSFIPLSLRSGGGAAPAHSLAAAAAGEVVFDAGGTESLMPAPSAAEVAQAWPTGEGVRGPLLELVGYDRQYDKVAAFLLGDVLVVDNLSRAVDLFRAGGAGKMLVTLDGETIDPHGVVTGGSRDGAQAGVLSQKREIRELESLLGGIETDLAASTDRQVALKLELEEATTTLARIDSELRAAELARLSGEKDLDRAGREAREVEARSRQLTLTVDDLRRSDEEAVRRVQEVEERLTRERAAVQRAEQDVEDLRASTLGLAGRMDEMVTRLTDLKVTAAQAADRKINTELGLSGARHEKAEQEARADRLRQAAGEQRERAETLRADSAVRREQAELQLALSEEKARQHGLRRDVFEQRSGELARVEEEVRVLRARTGRLSEDMVALRLSTQQAELHRKNLEDSVDSRYRGTVLAEILSDYHLRAQIGSAERERTEQLRELIERMGEINLTAIEETEEQQKRFDFLTTQKADLESAMEQLEAAITKINRASRKRFEEVFEAVNARFQEVFPRLFRGGRARLMLTNPEDMLETGVDIVANPPGKKIDQNLELLSGGEKALTAVSLLFAIFLVKPSPFCVLDEVDAPLDDVNVTRYSQGLLEMTDRSQFIVITHNKQTMEIADRLCGVTMEEPGVSKLVAVQLRGKDAGRSAIVTQASALAPVEAAGGA